MPDSEQSTLLKSESTSCVECGTSPSSESDWIPIVSMALPRTTLESSCEMTTSRCSAVMGCTRHVASVRLMSNRCSATIVPFLQNV